MKYKDTRPTAVQLNALLRRHGYKWQGGTIFRSPVPLIWVIWGAAPTVEAAARRLLKEVKDPAFARAVTKLIGGK